MPLAPLLVGARPFVWAGGVSWSVPDDCDMLRDRFLKELLMPPPLPENRPFGESRRCGDRSVDLRTKLLSGKVERLRLNESRGKCPLVVAADTGLTSGEGVTPAMIGGRAGGGRGRLHKALRRAATRFTRRLRCKRRQGSRRAWLAGEETQQAVTTRRATSRIYALQISPPWAPQDVQTAFAK